MVLELNLSDDQYINIYDVYREELTNIANDEQLKKWGYTEKDIKSLKIRNSKDILKTYGTGIKIAISLKEMNVL